MSQDFGQDYLGYFEFVLGYNKAHLPWKLALVVRLKIELELNIERRNTWLKLFREMVSTVLSMMMVILSKFNSIVLF